MGLAWSGPWQRQALRASQVILMCSSPWEPLSVRRHLESLLLSGFQPWLHIDVTWGALSNSDIRVPPPEVLICPRILPGAWAFIKQPGDCNTKAQCKPLVTNSFFCFFQMRNLRLIPKWLSNLSKIHRTEPEFWSLDLESNVFTRTSHIFMEV